jgi:hypothetical protein
VNGERLPGFAVGLGLGRLRRTLTRRLTVILQGVLVLGIALSAWLGQWQNVLVTSAIVLVTLAPVALGRQLRIEILPEFETLAVLFVFASLFLGEVYDYYERFWWWDAFLHTGSGLLTGILGFVLVHVLNEETDVRLSMRPGFVAFFAFTFALAVGTLWEILEFAMDGFFGLNMQKSGLVDTMWDLIVNAIGALAMAVLGYRWLRQPERQPFLERWIARFVARNPHLFRRRRRRLPSVRRRE